MLLPQALAGTGSSIMMYILTAKRFGRPDNGSPPSAGGNANFGRNSNCFPGGGPQNGFQGRTGGAVGNSIGTAGPLRLWQSILYGQASWLIILALFSILACVQKFSGKKGSSQRGMLLFWTIWLITDAVFFSFADFWHRYYLCILAPAIAGLAGNRSAGDAAGFP